MDKTDPGFIIFPPVIYIYHQGAPLPHPLLAVIGCLISLSFC